MHVIYKESAYLEVFPRTTEVSEAQPSASDMMVEEVEEVRDDDTIEVEEEEEKEVQDGNTGNGTDN